MLFQYHSAFDKRRQFRAELKTDRTLQFPGAISPLTAIQIEKAGFDGVYISGSVLSNDLGYPDIGLTTLSEVTQRGRQIARVTHLPSIIDADTGFGEPMNVARTVSEMIELGLCGCHLEDQMNPKRCGHLDGKALVSTAEMIKKINAADQGRKMDPHFVIIARTDSRASEGLEATIDRAKAYIDAGADVIFPEALTSLKEFETFAQAVSVPILANMTEFGKSELFSYQDLSQAGVKIIIYPVTLLRVALNSTHQALSTIKNTGSQNSMLGQMQTRKELYELTDYEMYNQLDQSIYNFKV